MKDNFYKSILEQAPIGYAYHKIICNQDGKPIDYEFIEVNREFERLTGLKAFDIIGKKATGVLPTMVEEEFDWISFYGAIALNGEHKEFEQFSEHLQRWYQVQAYSPQKNYFITIFLDITQQKQKEKALQESYKRYSDLAEKGTMGIFSCDLEGNITYLNAKLLKILGSPSFKKTKEINLLSFPLLVDKGISASIEKCMVNNETGSYTVDYRSKWGKKVWVRIHISPQAENNEVKGALIILDDITKERQYYEKLKLSEQNFKSFFKTMDDLIFIANQQGRIFCVNDAVSKKLGYSANELKNMYVKDIYPDNKRHEVERIFSNMFAGKRDFCSLPLAKKDGTVVPVETSSWLGKWDGKECIFVISKDLSKEQEALQKFNRLFENNPAIMAVSTPERRLTEVNNAFVYKTGYKKEEALGKTSTELGLFVQPEKQQQIADEFKKYGKVNNLELKLKTKDDKILDGLYCGEVIESQGKKYFLTVMTDITTQKQAEKEAKKANEAKSKFLANMSHEIRTPMNGIMGFLQLLENTKLNEEQRDFINNIKISTSTLLAVINDILDVSKIESGKLKLDKTKFDLRSTIEDAVIPFTAKAKEKKLELHVMIKSELPQMVLGDPTKLRQVISNLVNNAVKFTEQGEIFVSAGLNDQSDELAEIIIKVEDTGIGMPSAVTEQIFEPFTQVDTSLTRKYGGTGLGLTICKSIVEMMDGEISVESEEHKGSTFMFTVKLKRADDKENHSIANNNILKGKKVLIVDNNAMSRDIAKEYLQEAGCVVVEANTGVDALSKLLTINNNDEMFNTVLVDYQTLGMNSHDLSAALKAIPTTKDIPLILLTSVAGKDEPQGENNNGYASYLTKPYRRYELLRCVGTVMKGKTNECCKEENFITGNQANNVKLPPTAKVLVVEDDKINRKFMQKLLQMNDLSCDTVENGQQAVQAYLENNYDIVFMDCQMPVMDGYQATRQIRKYEDSNTHTPIIAMTAYSMKGDAERCFAAGMDEYISKPFDITQVTAMLERYSVITEDTALSGINLAKKQKVLIVDDVPININILVAALEEDYEISVATCGEEALSIAHSNNPPDIILLDIMMPEMNGYEVCSKLKREAETKDIPIIFLTAVQEAGNEEHGLRLGAIDYITKPFNLPIVKAKLKNHLELKRYKDLLKENSWIDGLTQIANRRKFDQLLPIEMKRAKRSGSHLSVLVIDIDYFKKYNDTFGHLKGDECLRKVAQTLKTSLNRPGDLVARWGGEEFACLLPKTNQSGAAFVGEKLRKAIMELAIPQEKSLTEKVVTISVGVATSNPTEDISHEKLLKQSDDALYKAKEMGRNRVCVYRND